MPIEFVKMPSIFQEGPSSNSPSVQKDPILEAGAPDSTGTPRGTVQSWLAGSLVQEVMIATAHRRLQRTPGGGAAPATLVYGMSPDAAKVSTTPASLLQPPNALFGLNHYCFDVRDRILEINIGTATDANLGTNVGVTYNGGGTGGVALEPGAKYGLRVVAAGVYTGIQILNVADTTNLVLEVVGIAPDKNPDNNSSRIMAKVIPTVIQG